MDIIVLQMVICGKWSEVVSLIYSKIVPESKTFIGDNSSMVSFDTGDYARGFLYVIDEISEYFRDLFYDLLIESQDFDDSNLIKIKNDSGADGIRILGEDFYFVFVNANSVNKGFLYLGTTAMFAKNRYVILDVVHFLTCRSSYSASDSMYHYTFVNSFTMTYRGIKDGSFMINLSFIGDNTQNLRLFEVHKLTDRITKEITLGIGYTTVASGKHHPVATDKSIVGLDGELIIPETMATYNSDISTNVFTHNALMHQIYSEVDSQHGTYSYNLIDTMLVGNLKYYLQYNFYEIQNDTYYCCTDGTLWLIERSENN